MMPPTSIDGTDITGATIDGTDVQEITVDGQTVFTAETLPVAYSNLVAWYPFDSSFYGGSNADDVTALFNSGQSGDSTAFDGTVNGATYQSSGGVTDINAGTNSGAFDFSSGDFIQLPFETNPDSSGTSVIAWLKSTQTSGLVRWMSSYPGGPGGGEADYRINGGVFQAYWGGPTVTATTNVADGNYHMFASTYDTSNNEVKIYTDGVLEDTVSQSISGSSRGEDTRIGQSPEGSAQLIGNIDDVRYYTGAVLSQQSITNIYNNTKP